MNTPEKKKRFMREQLRDAIFAVHDGVLKRDIAKEFRTQRVYQKQHQSKWSRKLTFISLRRPQEPSGRDMFAVSVDEGPLTLCVRQSFPIVFLLFLFPVFGLTDLESDNCIKSRHVQTTFFLKIRFICMEVFFKLR